MASTRAAFRVVERGSVGTTYLSEAHDLAVRSAVLLAFGPAHPTANVPTTTNAAPAARRAIQPGLLICVS
jgi:hypothetical protein